MRTIKFRGKVADVNEWVCGYLVGEDKIYQTEERKGCKCGVGVFRVEPNTVGQFTGLYDKYGDEIYEGDIVKLITSTYAMWYIVGRLRLSVKCAM